MTGLWIVSPTVVILGCLILVKALAKAALAAESIREELARLEPVRVASGALEGETARVGSARESVRRR